MTMGGNTYAVIRSGGGWDVYGHAPTRPVIRRQVSADPTGSRLDEADQVTVWETTRLGVWVASNAAVDNRPWNVVATCVATVLGAPRIPLAGDVVFTGWTRTVGMTGLTAAMLADLHIVRDSVVAVLNALPPPEPGETRSPLAPTTTLLHEAVAGSIRRWAKEIPTMSRPRMRTVQLPEE